MIFHSCAFMCFSFRCTANLGIPPPSPIHRARVCACSSSYVLHFLLHCPKIRSTEEHPKKLALHECVCTLSTIFRSLPSLFPVSESFVVVGTSDSEVEAAMDERNKEIDYLICIYYVHTNIYYIK